MHWLVFYSSLVSLCDPSAQDRGMGRGGGDKRRCTNKRKENEDNPGRGIPGQGVLSALFQHNQQLLAGWGPAEWLALRAFGRCASGLPSSAAPVPQWRGCPVAPAPVAERLIQQAAGCSSSRPHLPSPSALSDVISVTSAPSLNRPRLVYPEEISRSS